MLMKHLNISDFDPALGFDDSENLKRCYKACRSRSSCQSFALPPNRKKYAAGWSDSTYRCILYDKACTKKGDGSLYWDSYQMGCYQISCSVKALDKIHVRFVNRDLALAFSGLMLLFLSSRSSSRSTMFARFAFRANQK